MANLPVREMVLYKHGVGFFVRQGQVAGQQVALTFRSDEINDVLKSLAVFDQGGGQVLGIHYQTPMDKAARLKSSSVNLSTTTTLRDLVRDLRGRECEMLFEVVPGSQEMVVGRIIGLDEIQTSEAHHGTVSVLTEAGVRVFDYNGLRSLKIRDDQSAHDLSYFLDTSMAEDDRRVVTVRLSEGDHDLAVYYVAPSPTWRVSYRLVAESDQDGSTGQAVLQGWGLFDNRLQEDLENVRVTLVAGQPISFIYDLYASRIPQRPTVQDESRVAPGPIEYTGGMRLMDAEEMRPARLLRRSSQQDQAMAPRVLAMADLSEERARGITLDAAQASTQAQTEAKDTGETFQYAVTTPVSVKRGESALVPIISQEIRYERELLYNAAKFPNHPVAALRYHNATGLTLERGPVTVVEDGDYKGEAVIPFTKSDNQVYVPYAVELGITVREDHKSDKTNYGIQIEDDFYYVQHYITRSTIYTLENGTDKAQVVTIEAPINADAALFDTRQPDVETLNEQRWHVAVPAKSTLEFVRTERQTTHTRHQIRNMSYRGLERYLENAWLDQTVYNRLKAILDTITEKAAAQQQLDQIRAERNEIYDQQAQLRANMSALQPTGQEAPLRNRLLKQLENTQDRLEAIEREIKDHEATIDAAEKTVTELIAALTEATT